MREIHPDIQKLSPSERLQLMLRPEETMTELFDIEPTVPKWRELADLHGIFTTDYNEDSGTWVAWIDWFRSVEHESGDTEEEATVRLIHRLRLTGWETVSL